MSEKNEPQSPPKSTEESPNDFWDLGDDDLDLVESVEEQENSPKETAPPEADLALEEPVLEEAPKSQPEEDSVQGQPKNVAAPRHQPEGGKIPTSFAEKISLSIVVLSLVLVFAWGLSTFISEAPQGKVIPFKEEYPAKGENVTITAVKTWWKKPVRTGENADTGIVLEAKLVPCTEITLGDSGSTTLRVTFRNGQKELIGDTINLRVEDGKFLRSNSEKISIHSTAGFNDASRINSYTHGDIAPWTLIITEGSTGNEDTPLVKARVSANSSPQ